MRVLVSLTLVVISLPCTRLKSVMDLYSVLRDYCRVWKHGHGVRKGVSLDEFP